MKNFQIYHFCPLGTIWSAGASGKSLMERDSERSAEELGGADASWLMSQSEH